MKVDRVYTECDHVSVHIITFIRGPEETEDCSLLRLCFVCSTVTVPFYWLNMVRGQFPVLMPPPSSLTNVLPTIPLENLES